MPGNIDIVMFGQSIANGMTAYICRRFVGATDFLVMFK